MSIVECSSCKYSDIYFKFNVPGQCKTHLYCSKCLKENSTREKLKSLACSKCTEFYSSELNSKLFHCEYCAKELTFDTICSKHLICGNCISSWPIEVIKNCFGCLQIRYHVCNFCKKYTKKKTLKCPTHYDHRYCSKCYKILKNNHENSSCELCKITFKNTTNYNACFICKENSDDFNLRQCYNYILCIRCLNFLSLKSFLPLYPEITATSSSFINPSLCIRENQVKYPNITSLLSLKEKCQSCWQPFAKMHNGIDSKLVMLSCKYEHAYCFSCFKMPEKNRCKISCEHCSEYFSTPESTCYFCRKPREICEKIKCRHIICLHCLIFINENNSIRYIKGINCNSCKNFLCNNYKISKRLLDDDENIIDTFRNKRKDNLESKLNIYCIECQKVIDRNNYCIDHPLCRLCFSKNMQQSSRKSCKRCIQEKKNFCRKCLNVFDNFEQKIKNIKCPYDHFYCSTCFEIKNNKIDIDCHSCKMLYEVGVDSNCIFCKDRFRAGSTQWCNNHNVCKLCCNSLSRNELECYTKVFGCDSCNENFKNQRKEENKSSQNKNFIEKSLETFSQNPEKTNKATLESSHSLKYDIPRNFNIETRNIKNQKNENLSVKNIIHSVQVDKKIPQKIDDSFFKPDCQNNPKSNSRDKQQEANKSKKLDLENLYILNAKTNKTFCCEKEVERMECGHPLCLKCAENAFENKFNLLIKLIIERNYDSLNSISWNIGCYTNECYLKHCFPFEIFKERALKIVQTNNYHKKLVDHFDLLFEGIKYNFYECKKCKYVTGDKPGGSCMWCN
ncbi:hypothetical protein SteCoe_14752 [Stentor coeruleus]|uniref:RING-type domain-containing protein n=1 Tax=Stentor coeruleus TaxID=5963 RepID=A0A1R2C5D0_9CILI|nr:hypothetical protein SteCoe_14752 [Stentor coeruleus]